MKCIKINTEFITLGQLLKLASIISSGGEAKHFLQETTIKVNNELENRRGKKLYKDDVINIENHGEFKIEL